jgi:hypothetical protein
MRAGAKFRIQNSGVRSSGKKTFGIPLPSQPPSQSSPLCGLRDLCAMLSPGESFSHRSSGVSRRDFPHSLRPNHSPSVASVTSVRCFPLAASSSMGMPRNFRTAFTNQKVEINSLVRLQDVIEKQSVPSARRCRRGDPFGLSSSEFFV